ncbi:MAG TPA: MarR family transcriptional regulator, partial [Myxococcaceae bacterium]|nr:MarR family transcriptional regulator [Myxococcaceae bacterium]
PVSLPPPCSGEAMGAEVLSNPGREAWAHLHQLIQIHKRELTLAFEQMGLSATQAFVLFHMSPGKPVPMKALASMLICDASNVTGLVDRLESRGWVVRRGADNDRRIKMLVLTPAGEALRQRVQATLETPPVWISLLSVEDQGSLRDVLSRSAQLGGSTPEPG